MLYHRRCWQPDRDSCARGMPAPAFHFRALSQGRCLLFGKKACDGSEKKKKTPRPGPLALPPPYTNPKECIKGLQIACTICFFFCFVFLLQNPSEMSHVIVALGIQALLVSSLEVM